MSLYLLSQYQAISTLFSSIKQPRASVEQLRSHRGIRRTRPKFDDKSWSCRQPIRKILLYWRSACNWPIENQCLGPSTKPSCIFSYRHTDDRISFPCKHRNPCFGRSSPEDHVANKALENKWWSRAVAAIYPRADLKGRDISFNRTQWLEIESCH